LVATTTAKSVIQSKFENPLLAKENDFRLNRSRRSPETFFWVFSFAGS
jgi:hypothetical protein